MNTDQKLNKLDDFLHTISTETTTGLGGEAGYYVFSYDPKDEMKVRSWTTREIEALRQAHRPVVEFDLYKIMTTLLADKHPRKKYEELEMRHGSMTRVVNAANSVLHIGLPMDLMLDYIVEHIPKEDAIILLTGVGKCYPLLRSHKILNDLHDRLAQGIVLMMFPGKYCSDFAMQITSDVMNAQTYTINFQNNNLSGTTSFLEGYKSSKTRICVTVGMMTTGYDCEDLLNIGLLRPIFSPTDFIQIKGRGTRKHDFIFKERNGGQEIVHKYPKETFKLFDFFGNCEYFEEKFDYDEVLKLPRFQGSSVSPGTPPVDPDGYENFAPDPLKTLVETKIGAEGMKIDRMYFDKFEETVKEDPVAREQYEQGNYPAVIRYIDDHIMNQPNEYYTWDKLRRSIGSDRRITAREILDKIFGVLPFFKSKKELVEDEFEGYALTHSIPSEKYADVKEFFATYVTDKDVRRAIEDRKFQLLGTDISTYTMADLKHLGLDSMQSVVDYVADNVNVSRFM